MMPFKWEWWRFAWTHHDDTSYAIGFGSVSYRRIVSGLYWLRRALDGGAGESSAGAKRRDGR